MKSKASYFSISKPLIIENMRRFWAIPVLSFLIYFLSGAFPILMSYNHLDSMADYVAMSLNNQQPFYMFAHLFFPIIAAVVIFRYLQGISSVSVVHSMPFTRAKLYNSGFVSGLILITAPILANGVILFAISKPVFNTYATMQGPASDAINVFARANILHWIWISILITFTIYAVSVFVGIVTGTSLMHFAIALWFNYLLPLLYGIFIVYFSQFLYGFDTTENWMDYGVKISPFLNTIENAGEFGTLSTVFYIISFFMLYGITMLLYQRRKLEHASDSMAFEFMEPIICYLIAFLGMTLLGFYFNALKQSDLYMYVGFAAGTLIFFIIGQMIVKKTPRVFNIKGLKSFGIYCIIAFLFILGLNFDLTGFEKRLPNSATVESVGLNSDFDFGYTAINSGNIGFGYRNSGKQSDFAIKNSENIKAIIALHRSIVQNKSLLESPGGINSNSIYLRYNTSSPFTMTRRYAINYNFYKSSEDLKKIYESSEFKNYFAPSNLDYISLVSININSDSPISGPITIQNKDEMQEFINCLDKDFKLQSFSDTVSLKHGYASAYIDFTYKDAKSVNPKQPLYSNAAYKITSEYKNTIIWIREHGYEDSFIKKAKDIDYIELYHYVADTNTNNQPNEYRYNQKMVTDGLVKTLKVSDPIRIQGLLDTYETQTINYNDYYYGIVVYKGGKPLQNQSNINSVPNELIEKYGTADIAGVTMQIYFNQGNIPDYVLNYFKEL